MKNRLKNEAMLILFCALLGAFAGAVLWIFLKLVGMGTALIWEKLPAATNLNSSVYPIVICTLGGLIIGIYRKSFGDYPDDMMKVIATVKKTGSYEYRKILIIMVAAILPLIFGSSVGPEAGMIGVIVALGCWVSDNVKFAGKNSKLYSKVGMAVSLSVLFHAPLFGFFTAQEDLLLTDEENVPGEVKQKNIIVYAVCLVSSLAVVKLMNGVFGEVMGGFPSFEAASPQGSDFLMLFVYIIAGIALGLYFEKSEHLLETVSGKLPKVIKELLAGLILGIAVSLVPMLQFSGEEQMGELIADYSKFAPLALIGIALLKVLLTNICIQFGLKGGHFFPLIFAAVALGYGISLLVFPLEASRAVFAAAVTAAATLGATMKKPIAVTVLLFLCFPVSMSIWLFASAALSSRFAMIIEKKDA